VRIKEDDDWSWSFPDSGNGFLKAISGRSGDLVL